MPLTGNSSTICGSYTKQQYIADLPNLSEGSGIPSHILHYDIIVTIVIIKIVVIIKFSVLETIVIILVNFCFLISFEW